MQHLDDIVTTARVNVEDRERRAAQRRLQHEASLGRPSLLQRIARFRRRPTAAQPRRTEPEPTLELEPAPNHR